MYKQTLSAFLAPRTTTFGVVSGCLAGSDNNTYGDIDIHIL